MIIIKGGSPLFVLQKNKNLTIFFFEVQLRIVLKYLVGESYNKPLDIVFFKECTKIMAVNGSCNLSLLNVVIFNYSLFIIHH